MDLPGNQADTSLFKVSSEKARSYACTCLGRSQLKHSYQTSPRRPRPQSGGLGKILVVEDNDELREVATQLVEGLGCSVCSASTGAEAMATLAQDPKIDILFTDVLMPGGMNGFELAVEIRRTRPEIAVLVTSGFPGNLLPRAQQHGGFEMIPKPYTLAELAAALAGVRALPPVQISTPAMAHSS